MLWIIIVILVMLWLLSFIGHVGGGLIHLLLVIARVPMRMLPLGQTMVALVFYGAALSIAVAQDDAIASQRRAIERFEAYRQNVLKTGDRLEPELEQAAQELTAGLQEFDRAGNEAASALSLLKLGQIRRQQDRCAEATGFFKMAAQRAKRVGDAKSQAIALTGLGRCELEKNKDFAAAAAHLLEAATIASELQDRDPLFNALCYQAQVKTATDNLVGAADFLNRALGFAPQVTDQSLVLFAYLDRAEVFENLAKKAVAKRAFKAGRENLNLAEADYKAALSIARQFGYAGILPHIEQLLQLLSEAQKMLNIEAKGDA